jgi:hypothetical protein
MLDPSTAYVAIAAAERAAIAAAQASYVVTVLLAGITLRGKEEAAYAAVVRDAENVCEEAITAAKAAYHTACDTLEEWEEATFDARKR